MKSKLLLMAILCAIAFNANAQTEKGNNLIGGTIAFTSSKSDNEISKTKANGFLVKPSYGYFFAKNLAIGLHLGLNHSKTTSSYQTLTVANDIYMYNTVFSTFKQQSVDMGPFVRYYVDISDKFKFFGQFNAAIGFGKMEDKRQNYLVADNKFTSYQTSINPGFALFPSKRWAIEFSFNLLSYEKMETKQKLGAMNNKVNNEKLDFGFNTFNPSIGLNFHF